MAESPAGPDARPPVIVAGCHRSGTSLLTAKLRELGLWTGAHLDPNDESLFFLRRNEWIMRRAGGAWDYPRPTVGFLADGRFRDDVVARLARDVPRRCFADYAGRGGPLGRPRLARLRAPWGWKDPRNVFTLPVWERVFPGARRLLIMRHGVDAAASLWTRERSRWTRGPPPSFLDFRPMPRRLMHAGRPWERLDPYLVSTRCRSLETAFALWEEYAEAVVRARDSADAPTLVVRFEELLAHPEVELGRAARFCGLDPADEDLARACRDLRGDRARAWERDAELADFHERVRSSPWLAATGY